MFQSFCQFIESHYRGFRCQETVVCKNKTFLQVNFFAAAAAILYASYLI